MSGFFPTFIKVRRRMGTDGHTLCRTQQLACREGVICCEPVPGTLCRGGWCLFEFSHASE